MPNNTRQRRCVAKSEQDPRKLARKLIVADATGPPLTDEDYDIMKPHQKRAWLKGLIQGKRPFDSKHATSDDAFVNNLRMRNRWDHDQNAWIPREPEGLPPTPDDARYDDGYGEVGTECLGFHEY